jgi:hypothetical protein
MFLKLQNNIYQNENEGLFWCILQTPPKKWRRILTYILATQDFSTRVHKIVENFFPYVLVNVTNEKNLLLLKLLHLNLHDNECLPLLIVPLTIINNMSQTGHAGKSCNYYCFSL